MINTSVVGLVQTAVGTPPGILINSFGLRGYSGNEDHGCKPIPIDLLKFPWFANNFPDAHIKKVVLVSRL